MSDNSFTCAGGKALKQQAQCDSNKNDFARIHADRIIFILIILGIISLFGSIILGIVLVQGLGWLVDLNLEKFNADTLGMANYVSDFLGGAVGLTVGFILDKICIDKINNVFHYKALMRVLLNELENINMVADMNIIVLLKLAGTVFESHDEADIEKLNKYQISPEQINILKNTKLRREHTVIKEYIIDDVAMTAETVSVIANIPFAKHSTLGLINNISIIHNEIGFHNDLSLEIKKTKKQVKNSGEENMSLEHLELEHLEKIKESISNIKKLISRDSQNAKNK